jgi:Nuclease-related domain/AAA domain/UvrD-like helicase C-terminal domain
MEGRSRGGRHGLVFIRRSLKSMVLLIPSDVRNDLSSGEARVFHELRNAHGADDWIVFHSLAMSSAYSGRYGEVDFVILIPQKGIVCVEVKGGGVACADGVWTTTNRRGTTQPLKQSPFEQARSGMWNLLKYIRRRFGSNSPEARCPMGWTVIFPDAVCPPSTPDFARNEVVDCTQLQRLLELIDNCPSLINELSNANRMPLSPRCTRRLTEAFRPDFDRPPTDVNLIWHAESRIRELTVEQSEVLKGLQGNRRILIEGAAGTGKTVMAIEAARDHASRGRRVLLTCFNRNLGEWLQSEAQSFGPGIVVCGNLHRLLNDRIVASSGADLLASSLPEDDAFGPAFFDLGAMAISELGETFDVIIVDEVQDFRLDSLVDVLRAWGVMSDSTRVLLCGDFARQALYQTGIMDSAAVIRLLPGAVDFVLRVNCRNTRRIGKAIDMTVGWTGARINDRQVDGAPVDFLVFKTAEGQLDRVDWLLNSLQSAGCHSSDIVILGPRRLENSTLATVARIGDLKVRRFEDGDPEAASYTTIHSFKGLERTAVVLIDIGNDLGAASDALLYVGMSRARSRLFVLIDERSKSWLDAMQTGNIMEQMAQA